MPEDYSRFRGLVLQMTPQLELSLRVLETPSERLGDFVANVPGLAIGEPDGDDPLLVIDPGDAWQFHEVPRVITGDVWIHGSPPAARANRAVIPRLRIVREEWGDGREFQFFLRALRARSRCYERVGEGLARLRPHIAVAQRAVEVEPVRIRQLAEALEMHEMTIQRVARGCRIENRHRVFALALGTSGLALVD